MFGFSIISLLTIANAIFANPIPENSFSNDVTLNTDLLASNNIESPTDSPATSPNVPFRADSTDVTELPQSPVVDCDSDAFVDDFMIKNSDDNIQKRFRKTSCPVPDDPATQSTTQPSTDESPKSTTSSGKTCSDPDLPHHVTCGGPEIIMSRVPRHLLGSVLNCVHGKHFNLSFTVSTNDIDSGSYRDNTTWIVFQN